MKKKNMHPAKLVLKKVTIAALTDGETGNLKGGVSGAASVCQACIPPTEPEGCSNGCPVTIGTAQTQCCPNTIGVAQTKCCATWPPLCDSIVVSCIG